jgi:thiamine kinase-like enzyme
MTQFCEVCKSEWTATRCYFCGHGEPCLESIRTDIQAACQQACLVRDTMPQDAYRDELSRIATALAELCNDVARLEMAELDMRGCNKTPHVRKNIITGDHRF